MMTDHGAQELFRRVSSTGRRAVRVHAGRDGQGIAADLGVERATLRSWLDKLGTGTRTDPDDTRSRSPPASRTQRMPDTFVPSLPETPEQRLARLEPLPVRPQFQRRPHQRHLRPPGLDGEAACALLDVRRSSFSWLAAAPTRAARTAANTALARRIRAVHDGDRTCGRPRITAELNDGAPPGQRVNHKRIGRVMCEHGIAGYRRRRRVRATIPAQTDHGARPARTRLHRRRPEHRLRRRHPRRTASRRRGSASGGHVPACPRRQD